MAKLPAVRKLLAMRYQSVLLFLTGKGDSMMKRLLILLLSLHRLGVMDEWLNECDAGVSVRMVS